MQIFERIVRVRIGKIWKWISYRGNEKDVERWLPDL